MPRVSICMPVYNQERMVAKSLISALEQDYKNIEVLVIDDCSTDKTGDICKDFPVKLYVNDKNIGLPANLDKLIDRASGEYIVLLCGDDVFTNPHVISDIVHKFEANKSLGVIGRYYYQYLDGFEGAVMTIRGDIFTSSCQPSGIGFRKKAIKGNFSNDTFIEVPSMVKKIIDSGWGYSMIQYDTIAARLHPGVKGNAATSPAYYKSCSKKSPTLAWYEILGKPIGMYMGFIQMKNSASWRLWNEIQMTIKLNKKCLLDIRFWFCALTALILPRQILRPISNWYRHRITRHFVHIITREEYLGS